MLLRPVRPVACSVEYVQRLSLLCLALFLAAPDPVQSLERLRAVIHQLPLVNRAILSALMKLLAQIAQHSEEVRLLLTCASKLPLVLTRPRIKCPRPISPLCGRLTYSSRQMKHRRLRLLRCLFATTLSALLLSTRTNFFVDNQRAAQKLSSV